MKKQVTGSISTVEVNDIQTEVAETYGVDEEEVNIEVVYQTTGSIVIDTDGTLSDEVIAQALEDEVSALLGIHEGNVEITIEDGVAFYTITSDTAESATDAQDVIADLTNVVDTSLPVDIVSVNVDPDISAEVVVTVDTSDAESNLNNAASTLEQTFADQGFDAQAESNFQLDVYRIENTCFEMFSSLLRRA